MKTPDWSQAPEWANYVAMDADGEWFWYSEEPTIVDNVWIPDGGHHIYAGTTDSPWTSSLSTRPNSKGA
jgi:hypothetical protein